MNSDNIITNEEKHATWSIEQLNTQRACHFQITYYKSTHARHKIQFPNYDGNLYLQRKIS